MLNDQGIYEVDLLNVIPLTLVISRTAPVMDLGQTYFGSVRMRSRMYRQIKVR